MLNTQKWSRFKLGMLFSDIYKAKPHDKIDLTPCENGSTPSIRFVTRTENNNGCDVMVVNQEFNDIELGNVITIGDTTSTCFYQGDNFIAGEHMVVCRAPWLNEYTGLFVATIIQKERYRYNYGRAFNMPLIKDTIIMLPTDKQGNPYWENIEKYMKKLISAEREFLLSSRCLENKQ